MHNVYQKLKNYLITASGFYTVAIAVIYLVAWFYNGKAGTKFNLQELLGLYGFIQAQITIKYGIDSTVNSERGKMPTKENEKL